MIIPPPFVQPLNLEPSNVAVPEYPFAVSHVTVDDVEHEHLRMYFRIPVESSGSAHPTSGCFVTIVLPLLETYPIGTVIVPLHVLQIFLHVDVSKVTWLP